MSLQLTGRLTADPIVRNVNEDRCAINFSVALVDADYRNQETAFLNDITLYASTKKSAKGYSQADVYLQSAVKGAFVHMNGLFKNTQWTDKNGVKKYGVKFDVRSAQFTKPFSARS